MGKLKYCKQCQKVSEYQEETIIEHGSVIRYVTCGNCNNKVKTTTNHIHYGDDAKK